MQEPAHGVSVSRIIGLVLALAVIAFAAPVVSYVGVVFGWTNPTQNPPAGSGILTALNGNLGINDSNPQTALSVIGTITTSEVTGLAAPVDDADAANKAYVDAAGGGGGSLVLYGIGLNASQQGQFIRPGGAVGAGCRGVYGGNFTAACAPTVNVAAGNGTPSCPVGWTEAYAGYGPMNTFFSWYGSANNDASGSDGDWDEYDIPDEAVIGTDSICSSVAYALMYDVTYAQAAQTVGGSNSVLTACNDYGCNTCRVCYK